jgi:hypothetical protein
MPAPNNKDIFNVENTQQVQNKIQTAQTQMGYYSIAISNRYA